MTEALQYLALAPLVFYLSTIVALLIFISRNILTSRAQLLAARKQRLTHASQPVLFILLTLGSFYATWYYMIKYMLWSFDNYEAHNSPSGQLGSIGEPKPLLMRMSTWLHDTGLFEEAWRFASLRPMNWWWSEQICLFTVGSWTAFLAVEGSQRRIRHLWAYMLLGELVAIAVAQNLFYLAALFSPVPENAPRQSLISPALWFPVLLSLINVVISPFTNDKTFLPNLLVMHALIFVPLLVSPFGHANSRFSVKSGTFHRICLTACLLLRVGTTFRAAAEYTPLSEAGIIQSFYPNALKTLWSHPAQSSIGWDAICTSLSYAAWRALQSEQRSKTISRLPAMPFVSVAVAAPWLSLGENDSSASRQNANTKAEKRL